MSNRRRDCGVTYLAAEQTRLERWTAFFLCHERGNVALIFALAFPALVLITVGAVDLHAVQSSRARLQDIAEAAALSGANELGLAIDDNVAVERAQGFVRANLEQWASPPDVEPTITVFPRGKQRVIQVLLDGHAPSFFANMLPPGGWRFRAEARAVAVGITPLCVLVSGGAGSKMLNIKDSGRLSAPQCLVHSNRDILVEGGSIAAFQVQAVTSARGVISPAPGTDAAPIQDPFRDLTIDGTQSCPEDKVKEDIKTGVLRIGPGIHCGGFKMAGDSVLLLEPGEHWFLGGHLEVKENARLQGDNVVLFFDKKSKFDFKDHARVNLDGRKTGAFAGMVMVATRENTQDFIITSDNVETLLGVIYVPSAQLIVEGGRADVARDSAWTVIVARSLQLKGAPSLIINANYDTSDVPVPDGVGPRDGGSRLIR